MGFVEGWHLLTVDGDARIGWFGASTREAAEAWYARESGRPYRPPFYMRGATSGVVIREEEE